MRNLISQLLAIGPELAAFILTTPLLSSSGAHAITQSTVASPNLDLSQLGRVALAGDFDSISLYTYQGQNENSFTTNGSQSLLTRYPNGAFQSLGLADAYIESMSPVVNGGVLYGVAVGGNFTSLGGVEAQGIALWNPNTTMITPLSGLNGTVSAVYHDDAAGVLYVGGSFTGANSTNAVVWTTGWTNLPFAGFNGPVSSIAKNAAGNIVFGGSFTGLGNTTTPKIPDGQVINLGSGNITASGTTTAAGFDNPANIICKTAATDGSGNTWLLADNTPGYWQGNFSFGFNPTKLRLYNTQQNGGGTKSWYFENLSSGGILNMTYLDTNGQNQSCVLGCPLPQDNSTYQDFHFQPPVGMAGFRINIQTWYGSAGGLSGIEMFQDDIYSFAVDDFNEPACDDVSTGSSSSANPASLWTRTPANLVDTSSDYLTAYITDPSQITPSTNVMFEPNIQQSGNYTITVYTPGCLQDNSCATRGTVNMTGFMTANGPPISATLFQTNNYDKYDQVYYGVVDITTDSFRPSVTLSPSAGQNAPLAVVAQRVRFDLQASNGGLNGLYEYNPNQATVSTDFSTSAINTAGTSLSASALVNDIVVYQDQVFVAGNFSSDNAPLSNVFNVGDSNATSLAGGGLNSEVMVMYLNGSTIYMGGNFTNTADNASSDLNGVAAYSVPDNTWQPLGAGVNGVVFAIVPLQLNVTDGDLQTCIALTGFFDQVNAFSSNKAFNASGFAVYVPAQNNWLHNIPSSNVALAGQLITTTNVPGFDPLFGGQIISQSLGLSDAVELVGSGQPALESLGVSIQPSSAANTNMRKRELSNGANSTGVTTGLFYHQSGLNITILGGQFSATASSGTTIQDLLFVNNTATQTITGVSGLESNSIFYAMDTQGTNLWAGGALTGTVNGNNVGGLVVYDLASAAYIPSQPPALAGGDPVTVAAISTQPNAGDVYVGGNFDTAGSLPCASLCMYDTTAKQWNSPGTGLNGAVVALAWASDTILRLGGNLTIGGNATAIASYDTKAKTFTTFAGSEGLAGPLTAMTPASSDGSAFWAAGTATNNNTAYLSKWDSGRWTGVDGFGAGTTILGLQVLSLASNHDSSSLLDSNQVLLISGNINVPDFGNASAVLFNGTTIEPFILTNMESGGPGSVSQLFVSNPQNFMNSSCTYSPLLRSLLSFLALHCTHGSAFVLSVLPEWKR